MQHRAQEQSISIGSAVFDFALFSTDADTTVQVLDSIIHSNNVLSFAETADVISADRNVYQRDGGSGSGAWFTIGGVLKTGLAEWQSASGLDANSAEGAKGAELWAGDLTEGDFSLPPESLAFAGGRAAGARKWRTRPDWDALVARWDAGYYAHPTDAVGGSQLVTR